MEEYFEDMNGIFGSLLQYYGFKNPFSESLSPYHSINFKVLRLPIMLMSNYYDLNVETLCTPESLLLLINIK